MGQQAILGMEAPFSTQIAGVIAIMRDIMTATKYKVLLYLNAELAQLINNRHGERCAQVLLI